MFIDVGVAGRNGVRNASDKENLVLSFDSWERREALSLLA